MIARLVVGTTLAACLLSETCFAAPPNDNWENRTAIQSLPFSESVPEIATATVEAAEPAIYCMQFGGTEIQKNSVWYRYQPGNSDAYVNIDGSGYDTVITVLEGNPETGFVRVIAGCNDDGKGVGGGSEIRGLRLRAGGDYSILVARFRDSANPTAPLAFSISVSPVRLVTKVADSNDGLCDADCSLREAITGSTGTASGAIVVPPGHYLVPGGLILPNNGFSIYGAGMDQTIVDAANTGRVMGFPSGPSQFHTIRLHGLSLVNGNSTSAGGALDSRVGYTVLEQVAVRNSTANSGNGGGAFLSGGLSTASIIDCEFSGNRTLSGVGGGAFLGNDHSEIVRTTFNDNRATSATVLTGGGGAVVVDQSRSVIRNSTFSGNSSNGSGGGLTLRIYSDFTATDLYNVTLVNNIYNSAGGVADGAGLYVLSLGPAPPIHPVTVTNSVLYNNRDGSNVSIARDCRLGPGLAFASGYSLAGVPDNCGFTASGDVNGQDPLLLPLATIGSTHPVHVPGIGSPLIDRGNPDPGCEATDQRGVVRPQDGDGDNQARCDIGAVERTLQDEFIFSDGFQ